MTAITWKEMFARYRGLWVALLDKELGGWVTVVATGKEFEEAEENAKKNGHPNAFVVFLQERNTLNIGGGYEIELSDVRPGEGVEADRS